MTGRDAELRTVRELFHAAARRRVPRLVLVSGPAGVGKSRLGWEFRKYIEGPYRAWFAALRGDTATATLAGLGDLRASENTQDKAHIAVAEAFTAAARHQPAAALRYARAVLGQAGVLGISNDTPGWAWPLAARAAHDLADAATATELLAMLDGYQPGQLPPMLRAERDLARARLTAREDGPCPAAAAAFTAAIAGLRAHSTPYHLAHGLLDQAEYLLRTGDHEAAGAAIGEARGIAQRLRCQPLLDRSKSVGVVPAA